jgi:GntP family gluconate:H+ symporter
MSLIASDIIRFSRNPLFALNLPGFLFSVPLMCYILAYVILAPIAKELAARLETPLFPLQQPLHSELLPHLISSILHLW